MVDKLPEAPTVRTQAELKNYWEDFSNFYAEYLEFSTQPLLYSLISGLKLYESNKVLELSCGGGKSLPLILSLKKPECEYWVSDFCENLLSLASKRMEFIERDINGSLQFWDKSCFQKDLEKTFQSEFPKSRTSFRLLNNENLAGIENEIFDVVFSNLSLQLVSNPEKMLSEAFRVVRKGGKVGFTVWGRKENSSFFTVVPKVLRKHGVELPNERSNFHLGEREKLMNMMKDAGFKNVLCWYQFFGFNFQKEEEFIRILEAPGNKKLFDKVPEEKRNEMKKEAMDEFMKYLQINQEPVGLEALIVIGWKEPKEGEILGQKL